MSPSASSATASGWSGTRRRRRGRWLPVLLVVAGAAPVDTAAGTARDAQPAGATRAGTGATGTRLGAAGDPGASRTASARASRPQADAPETPAVDRRHARSRRGGGTLQRGQRASVANSAAPAAEAAAPAPAGGLLDSEASRRAIREAARQRSTGEMGAQATGEKAPVSEQERMGQEIARGARGDCLKGEFAGSGMGLLSLPFWLMAELREKCRR